MHSCWIMHKNSSGKSAVRLNLKILQKYIAVDLTALFNEWTILKRIDLHSE